MSTLRVLDKDGNWVDIPTIVGPVGPVGPTGETGPGVSSGGSTGQILRKKSGDDFDTEWVTPTDMDLYYTKEEADDLINSKISTTFKYKGTKASYAAIQAVTNPAVGDVWNDASTDHNYVWNGSSWDKLAGTVDMSNYYTKDEAEDMVDSKLAEVPINNLLHYKGHVGTVEDLPSLGQTSGISISPVYNITQQWKTAMTGSTAQLVRLLTQRFDNEAFPYYIGTHGNSDTSTGSYQAILYTAFPDVFDAIYIHVTNYSFGGSYLVHVNASPDKPVHTYTWWPRFGVSYDDGTYDFIGSTQVISKPAWIHFAASQYSYPLVGYLARPLKFKIPNLTQFSRGTSSSGSSSQSLTDLVITNTLYNVPSSYMYNDGMYFCRFDNKETGAMSLILTEALAKENELYSVGSMHELYRCNAIPAWEKWSDFKEFQVTEMGEDDYLELSDKNTFDMYILDRTAEVTETTNLLLNSITGDVDLVEANISEEEALAITNEIIGGVSDE